MERQNVEITDITKLLQEEKIPLGQETTTGQKEMDKKIRELISPPENARKAYLLQWNGEKTPYGATIERHTITGTRQNFVYTEGGQIIGRYERTKESEGKNKKEQEMIIYLQ